MLQIPASLSGGARALALGYGITQRAVSAPEPPRTEQLTQNFQAEHEIGHRFHFDPAELMLDVVTGELVVIARDVHNTRALARLAQYFLQHVVV